MATNSLKLLDPVQGLVDFVLDIKPYHTKIVEVLIEYVYNEFVDVVIIDELHTKIDLFYPELPNETLPFVCEGGYSTRPYGDPGRYPIISPNTTIDFEVFPAIDPSTNSFTIPGNRAKDLKPGSTIYVTVLIEDYANVHSIIGVTNGPANISNPPTFVVNGNQTAQFVVGYVFDVNGTQDNDRSYSVISASTYNGTTNETTIPVGQSIISGIPFGQIGIIKTLSAAHSGEFTVESAEYNQGMIDSWPDITDPTSFSWGNDPHTIVTTIEPLTTIPVLVPTQVYTAFINIAPILVEGMLSYSNYIATYTPSLPDFAQTPDEGRNIMDIISVTPSTLDGFGFPIPDSGKFVVPGNFSISNVFVGDKFNIVGSANNGLYTITSLVYNNTLDETTFGVADLVVSNTTDGNFIIDIPANVFIVDGDWTTRFIQGTQFNIVSGSANSSRYTTLKSEVSDGKTWIRVLEDIVNTELGFDIKGTTGGFNIRGNVTTRFTAGTTFNVVGSSHNDGQYIVDVGGSTYDPVADMTTLPVTNTIDLTINGTIHHFISGLLVDANFGYSEDPTICDYVPETVVHVTFDEHLVFSSGHIELSDDVIVYNLENSDTWGYELPIDSIFATTAPALPEQPSPPLTPVASDLWYNTTSNIFNQFDGTYWKVITTAWWMDLTNNQMHYRTKDKFVDTGWVLDSNKSPGFSDVFPAVGETELLFSDEYSLTDQGGGVLLDTFTLSGSVPNIDPSLISVTINNIPAGITLNSATEFTLLHPDWKLNDVVVAKVFDRSRAETNAHVLSFNQIPHVAYHEYVTVDAINNAYVVGGGNFTNRFAQYTTFDGIQEGVGGGILNQWTSNSFPIVEVDDILGTITVIGDHTWLFVSNRVFTVRTSENNTNSFIVNSSLFDGTYTTIAVTSPPVIESPLNTLTQQYFYNPGVVVYNIDEVSDTIIVLGNVVDVYTTGLELLVQNSTVANNAVWVVGSATYDSINNRTNISIAGNIPDPDSSAFATLHTPIFQNYSRDLGVILGAVYDPGADLAKAPTDIGYDPLVDGIYNIGQVKTIVATSNVNVNVTGISYEWLGPMRLDILQNRSDSFIATLADSMGVSDELLSIPDRHGIITTNATGNYFVIGHTDPITGLPVNLTDSFTPLTIFDVVGSYGNSSPTTPETNDGKFVVSRSFWDDPSLVGVPAGIPAGWVTGSGNTFIEIEGDFNNIPPYNSFNVVGVSNNGASPNTIRISGDHAKLFSNFIDPIFRLDQPLVSATAMFNNITVTNIAYDSLLIETVLTVEEEFINETFVGALGLVEVAYNVAVNYDNTIATLPWINGDILRESVRIDQTNDTLTTAVIEDNLSFGWGTVELWPISFTDHIANLELIDLDGNAGTPDVRLFRGDVSIDTDITSILELNDRVTIKGSQGNDDIYEIAAMSYNVGLTDTELVLRNQPKTFRVTTNADIAGNTDGTYFLLSSATTSYYVWLDVDNNGNNPSIVGKTGLEVHVTSGATANDLATNLAFAIDSNSEFSATTDNNVVTITALSSLDPQQYAYDFNTGFVVDNYTISYTPVSQLGYLELKGIDITNWFQYLVKEFNAATSEIIVHGNAVGNVQSGQQIRVLGTQSNDQLYTLEAPITYDNANNITFIKTVDPLVYGSNSITELPSSTTIKVLGDSYRFISSGNTINVVNSSGNNGVYTVTGMTQQGIHSVLNVTPSLPNITPDGDVEFFERGGWIESVRYQGINIVYEDVIGIQFVEVADAAVLTEGGSVVGSWDYTHWDIGSYDESLGTVIHLYSNVFNA